MKYSGLYASISKIITNSDVKGMDLKNIYSIVVITTLLATTGLYANPLSFGLSYEYSNGMRSWETVNLRNLENGKIYGSTLIFPIKKKIPAINISYAFDNVILKAGFGASASRYSAGKAYDIDYACYTCNRTKPRIDLSNFAVRDSLTQNFIPNYSIYIEGIGESKVSYRSEYFAIDWYPFHKIEKNIGEGMHVGLKLTGDWGEIYSINGLSKKNSIIELPNFGIIALPGTFSRYKYNSYGMHLSAGYHFALSKMIRMDLNAGVKYGLDTDKIIHTYTLLNATDYGNGAGYFWSANLERDMGDKITIGFSIEQERYYGNFTRGHGWFISYSSFLYGLPVWTNKAMGQDYATRESKIAIEMKYKYDNN